MSPSLRFAPFFAFLVFVCLSVVILSIVTFFLMFSLISLTLIAVFLVIIIISSEELKLGGSAAFETNSRGVSVR